MLPDALRRPSGAEVQRLLATVVVDGVITSTILALVVVPAIFKYFSPAERGR